MVIDTTGIGLWASIVMGGLSLLLHLKKPTPPAPAPVTPTPATPPTGIHPVLNFIALLEQALTGTPVMVPNSSPRPLLSMLANALAGLQQSANPVSVPTPTAAANSTFPN